MHYFFLIKIKVYYITELDIIRFGIFLKLRSIISILRILVQGLYNEKKTKISLEGSNHSRKKERHFTLWRGV